MGLMEFQSNKFFILNSTRLEPYGETIVPDYEPPLFGKFKTSH